MADLETERAGYLDKCAKQPNAEANANAKAEKQRWGVSNSVDCASQSRPNADVPSLTPECMVLSSLRRLPRGRPLSSPEGSAVGWLCWV